MRIIKEIEDDPHLLRAVQACDGATRQEFADLVAYRKTKEFEAVMGLIRHKLAFHFDDKLVRNAIRAVADRYPGHVETITMGRESIDWYFGPGALINERIAVRFVFKIPEDSDVHEAANAIWDRLFVIASMFTRFAGHFAWQAL
jgi:hypothetical protein